MKAKYKVTGFMKEHGCKTYLAIQKRACRCVEDLRRPNQENKKIKKERKKDSKKSYSKSYSYDPNNENAPNIQDQVNEMLKKQKEDL